MSSDPPEGFKPFRQAGAFADLTGPIYYKKLDDGDFAYGFRVDDKHLNPNGVAHGGMLFTFADQIIGRMVAAETKRISATIKLNVEYLAPGKPGDWIEGRAETLRITRDLAYMRARVNAGHHTLMTGQGIWRLFGHY
ncbi:MAG: PaaI family thioesterase [Alphaproteobacteria bacterium]